MSNNISCPKCNSDEGFYAIERAIQIYDCEGNAVELVKETKTQTVYCFNCGYKTTLKKLQENGGNKK